MVKGLTPRQNHLLRVRPYAFVQKQLPHFGTKCQAQVAPELWRGSNGALAKVALNHLNVSMPRLASREEGSRFGRDMRPLRQPLTERDVFAWQFIEQDDEVVGRDAGGSDNARVKLFEQREPDLLWPPRDERQFQ